MPDTYRNIGGTWTKLKSIHRNVAGTWRKAVSFHRNLAGTWRQVHTGVTPIAVTISASTNNVNLFTLAGSPAGIVAVTVTINSGVVIGSASTGSPALTTGSGWAAGSTITVINNGLIEGMGGAGGGGGTGGASPTAGTNGSAGGDAWALLWPASIDNTNGNVFGGGGGGGGAGGASMGSASPAAGGGGGGGGAGTNGGALGGNGAGTAGYVSGINRAAGAGTAAAGGTNGVVSRWDSSSLISLVATSGGVGGGPGAAGAGGTSTGGDQTVWGAAGAGGPAGYAVRQNGHAITWLAGLNGTQVKGTVA